MDKLVAPHVIASGPTPSRVHMLRWRPATDGVSSSGTTSTDVYGNALGGVRTLYLDVPTQTYYPTTPGTGSCEFLWGHAVPFAGYFLHGLYATHQTYVSKIQQDAQSRVASHWLVANDARQIESEAERAHVP